MSNKKSLHQDQAGIVSFVVTIIIILILSLIVLAFAQLVRREQRQAFDRQLNTQALYAAESGVNDATQAINQAFNDPLSTLLDVDYDECEGANSFISRAGLNSSLESSGTVAYSCLLVDPSPETLEYSSVPEDSSVVVPLRAEGGVAIQSMQIEWGNPSGTVVSGCPAVNAYPRSWPNDTDCNVGMLRAELVPFSGTTNRNNLITNRSIMFLQPNNTSSSVSVPFSAASGTLQGRRVADGCSTSRCSVTITNIPSMTRGYLRLRSIYRANPVTIRAYTSTDGTGTPVGIVGAQAEIDATGRASDILRRIKVRRQITDGSVSQDIPEFAIQSARTLCKRLAVTDTSASVEDISGFTPSECNITTYP